MESDWQFAQQSGPSLVGWYLCNIGPADVPRDMQDVVVLHWDGMWNYRGRVSQWAGDVKGWRGPLVIENERTSP